MRHILLATTILILAGCGPAPSKPIRTVQIDTVFDVPPPLKRRATSITKHEDIGRETRTVCVIVLT